MFALLYAVSGAQRSKRKRQNPSRVPEFLQELFSIYVMFPETPFKAPQLVPFQLLRFSSLYPLGSGTAAARNEKCWGSVSTANLPITASETIEVWMIFTCDALCWSTKTLQEQLIQKAVYLAWHMASYCKNVTTQIMGEELWVWFFFSPFHLLLFYLLTSVSLFLTLLKNNNLRDSTKTILRDQDSFPRWPLHQSAAGCEHLSLTKSGQVKQDPLCCSASSASALPNLSSSGFALHCNKPLPAPCNQRNQYIFVSSQIIES